MANYQIHPNLRTLVDRVMAPKDTGSNATMPKHHWLHAVTVEAGVSAEFAETHAEKLTRWFNAGEQVWSAADGLRFLAQRAKIEDAADADANALRRHIINDMRGGDDGGAENER